MDPTDQIDQTDQARLHSVRQLYRGRVFGFCEEEVTLPNGRRTTYGVVRHPGSTGIVPVADDGTVVMTRQYRHPVGGYLLEIPAGTNDPGESSLTCAYRELEEETGMRADELVLLNRIHILPAYTDEVIHVYLARGLRPSRQNLDPDEVLTVEHHSFDALMAMIADGRITDALTILALQRARTYLREKVQRPCGLFARQPVRQTGVE
jgi:ADP-ribose pyrophosphatase